MTSAPDPLPSLAAETVVDLEREYLLQNYSRYPLVIHRGKGCHVYDVNGARYLDFIAGIGVNALGHAHPAHRQGDPRTGAPADPLVESLLPRVSGTAGQAPGRNQRPAAHLLCQQRHRGHGRRAEDDPLARQQAAAPASTKSFPSTTRFTAARWARFRSPASPNTARISSRCCRASASSPPTIWRSWKPRSANRTAGIVLELIQGEGGIYPDFARVSREERASWPTATTPCWCSTKFNAAWDGRAPISPISAPSRWCCRT